jgi:hypothetical protein
MADEENKTGNTPGENANPPAGQPPAAGQGSAGGGGDATTPPLQLVAKFKLKPDTVVQYESISFSNESTPTDKIDSYSWQIWRVTETGSVPILDNHHAVDTGWAFDKRGNYIVMLTITGGGKTVSTQKIITVRTKPRPLAITLLGAYLIIFAVICLIGVAQLLSSDGVNQIESQASGNAAEATAQATGEATSETQTQGSEVTAQPTAEATTPAPKENASSGSGTDKTQEPLHSYNLWFWTVDLTKETWLLLLVVLSGALGSLVHAMRSYGRYVGDRIFLMNWNVYYVNRPFIGGALAFVFYLIVRGGLFTSNTPSSLDAANPFGFFAIGGLVGLFSEQALEKLKEIAETVFAVASPGTQTVATPGDSSSGSDQTGTNEGQG